MAAIVVKSPQPPRNLPAPGQTRSSPVAGAVTTRAIADRGDVVVVELCS